MRVGFGIIALVCIPGLVADARPVPPPPDRRARFAAVSLTAAGALALLLPPSRQPAPVTAAAGAALSAVLPIGEHLQRRPRVRRRIRQDIIKTIFSSILTLFFGGSWKVLMHPYEIVEWLIRVARHRQHDRVCAVRRNDAQAGVRRAVKDTQSIGLGLLPLPWSTTRLHLVSGGVVHQAPATTCTTSARCSPPPS